METNRLSLLGNSCWNTKNNSSCGDGNTLGSNNEVTHPLNCLVCGTPLVYLTTAQKCICSYCEKEFDNYVLCPNGHFICEKCHNRPVIDKTKYLCLKISSPNPYFIFGQLLKNLNVPMLGCHHAFMVAGSLLGALKNKGSFEVAEKAIDEVFSRIANQAIGGYCGLTGVCGIVPAVGSCFAFLVGSRCGTDKEQKLVMKITAEVCSAIANLTGPSCCKAYSWKSMEIAIKWLKDKFNITIDSHKITCNYKSLHPHGCRKEKCPYYYIK